MENWKGGRDFFQEVTQKLTNTIKKHEEFVAKTQIEPDKQELMNCPYIKRNATTVSQLLTLKSGFIEQCTFFVRCKRISRFWDSEELWSVPRSHSTLVFSESRRNAQPRFWIAARYGILWVLQETFLKAHLLEKDHPQLSSKKTRNLESSSQELRPDIPGNYKATGN